MFSSAGDLAQHNLSFKGAEHNEAELDCLSISE